MPHLGGGDDVNLKLDVDGSTKQIDYGTLAHKQERRNAFHFNDDYGGFDGDVCCNCGLLVCCFRRVMSYLLFGTTKGKNCHSLLDAILQVQCYIPRVRFSLLRKDCCIF